MFCPISFSSSSTSKVWSSSLLIINSHIAWKATFSCFAPVCFGLNIHLIHEAFSADAPAERRQRSQYILISSSCLHEGKTRRTVCILISVMNNLHHSDSIIYAVSEWCAVNESWLYCFPPRVVLYVAERWGKPIFIPILIFDTCCSPSLGLFYSLLFAKQPLNIPNSSNFWPVWLAWGGAVYCCSYLKHKKKYPPPQKNATRRPPVWVHQSFRWTIITSVFSAVKNRCERRRTKEKPNVSARRKRAPLIERESTSGSGWMSGGVIGDWLQIMNNCIKGGRPLVHASPAAAHACALLFLCSCATAGTAAAAGVAACVHPCVSLSWCVCLYLCEFVCVCV